MAKTENKTVIKKLGDKSRIFCQEDYAQELYDLYNGSLTLKKDFTEGDIVRVTDMKICRNPEEVEIICENFDSLFFTLQKERKFLEIMGMNEISFREWLESGQCKSHFEAYKTYATVENSQTRKGSLYSAHLRTIVKEFKEQIAKPTSAYTAKILSKNQGGFLVEVSGIKAFLPGSLAAANKISNFDEYIGKEIFVMIEDYLVSSDIFVVSYKKYLDYILPGKLGDLERNQLLTGTVTGTSKFGVFAEFNDVFTGLLHTAEMSPSSLEKFNAGLFRPGSSLEVWLKDIKDSKLILTEVDPSIRINEMEEFRESSEGKTQEAIIVSIKPHGALMEIKKGILGLLPIKEMKKSGKRLNVGESLEIFIKKVDTTTGKIYLSLCDEPLAAEA